jgi:AcrR family transcriptional regulator
MPKVKTSRTPPRTSLETRQRLVAATTGLLATAGFAGTTTRAIGEAAGCNPALVAYHFGSLNALLLEALDASSESRMRRYAHALGAAGTRREALATLRQLYSEDRQYGHVALVAQLVAGGLMDRTLGREVARRMQPWVTFAQETIAAHVPAAVLRRLPARELAYAIVAGFLGLELLDALLGEQAEGGAVLERLTA